MPRLRRSYVRAIAGKVTRWAIILSLLAALAHHFVR